MAKVGVVVLADTEASGDFGRAVNAMLTVKELKEAGDEVKLIFDGAGTKWIPVLNAEDHKYHQLFQSIQDQIAGVCSYCAKAFGVKDQVAATGIKLLEEYEQHPSLRSLITEGYQIITF